MSSPREQMSKRERVEAALNLQETDRTPIFDILFNDAAIEYFAGRRAPLGEEGLKVRLQASGRMLDMTRLVSSAPLEVGETASEDGFVHYRLDPWIHGGISKRPFSDVEGAKRYVEYALNLLRQDLDVKKYAESFHAAHEKVRSYLGDDTVVVYEYDTGLDWVRFALGIELFCYVSADAPELISEYIELSTAHEIEKIHAVADPKISPCAMPGGDIACKGRLLHSPTWLRKEFFPALKRVNDALHEHGIKCLFHSDGYIMDVMPDLIATGIDGLNPIEVLAGMDLGEVKRLYGDKLFLTGAIDMSQLLSNGTPDEVRRVCRQAIDVASPGYFIGSTTELDNSSKLENILAMVEVAWGRPA